MLVTIIYFQEISLSTVVQVFHSSATFIFNFRNTWLWTHHFWDNVNQISVEDLQGKKQSKRVALTMSIKTFPYITFDWPSEQQGPLNIGPRWNNKAVLGRRWCIIASYPRIIIIPKKLQMLSRNLFNPAEIYRLHLNVSFLGLVLDFCKVTAPR